MLRATASVLLVALGCGVASAQTAGDAVAAKRVLAIYTDDRLLPAVQQGEQGLRAGLAAGPPTGIEYFGEFFQAARFPMAGHGEVMHAYLLAKYRESPPDVLVAAGRAVLLFLLDHRQTLFPGTPIVFLGISEDELPRDRLDASVTGVPGSWDLLPAVELALRLQPDTTRMVVINGDSAREQELVAPLREAATRVADRMSFTWLTDRTLAQLKTDVAALPRGTVVLFLSQLEDAAGQFYLPRDVVEILAPLSSVPFLRTVREPGRLRARRWHDADVECRGPGRRHPGEADPGGRRSTGGRAGAGDARLHHRRLAPDPEVGD